MSGIPTESRIFADRYLRETRRLEKQHAGLLTPGAENQALRDIAPRLSRIGSPIKRVAALRTRWSMSSTKSPPRRKRSGISACATARRRGPR